MSSLPPSKCKVDGRFGPDLIIQMIHASPHEITLVPVGPLTNIALAVLKDPSIVPLVNDVIIMGGGITGGNVNAAAEANIYNDPGSGADCFSGRLDRNHGRTWMSATKRFSAQSISINWPDSRAGE